MLKTLALESEHGPKPLKPSRVHAQAFLRALYGNIATHEICISAEQQAAGAGLGSPVLWADLAQQAASPRGAFLRPHGVLHLTCGALTLSVHSIRLIDT